LAIQVDDERGTGAIGALAGDLGGVDGVGARVDVAEDRHAAGGHGGGDRRHASVGRHEHLVAGLDAERLQADTNGIGARPDADRLEPWSVVGGELGFEALELGSHQKEAAVEHARDGRVQLGSDGVHAWFERVEGDLDAGGHTVAATGWADQ
jgi:hypothetical protein